MDNTHVESAYPLTFRAQDAQTLGEHLRRRHCVELIGLKHVGISNFLRFFLYHPDITKTYLPRLAGKAGVKSRENQLFIPVDLNDLVEVEIFPFWILMFKRLVDTVEQANLSPNIKKEVSLLFLDSIQSQDLFLTIEDLRKALKIIVDAKTMPTFFLIRFDRLKDVLTPEFFANLKGLRDACAHKLAYVFTSFRSLDEIAPEVFPRKLLSLFSHLMYVRPAEDKDMKTIFETLETKYHIAPSPEILNRLLELCGGHVQYLQLSSIILSQREDKSLKPADLLKTILADERIKLLSEEIWESLNSEEQKILKNIEVSEKLPASDIEKAKYLTETGFIRELKDKYRIFCPFFEDYLKHYIKNDTNSKSPDLTKKEHQLYTFLSDNLEQVCERERIIEAVWPEYEDLGVTDWTIDRLVARLRTKLKQQNSPYSIITVKTRGYKLVKD